MIDVCKFLSEFAGETDMEKVVIKKMESEDEINGKGYVHYKSWHETYMGLIDADYLERQTLEKCIAIAHKWPDNILVAWVLKGNERAIRFYERFGFHFDGTEAEIMLGTPNAELRMIFERK